MNDCIIKNINSVVKPDDTLFHLGDFAFGNKSEIPALRQRINCKTLCLIKGNHDRILVDKYKDSFTSVMDYFEFRYHKVLYSLCHYPLGTWNEIGRGGVNLHGHSHGSYTAVGRQIDVGVDPCFLHPLSIKLIHEYMADVQPVLTDRHDENTNYG